MSYKNEGDEATKWFLRHHFRNHGLTVLRYFLKRGFMETLVKAYNICVTMVAQGHRHQLSIPQTIVYYYVHFFHLSKTIWVTLPAVKTTEQLLADVCY